MFEFEIGALDLEGPILEEWQALLRVSAPFCLRVDGFTVIEEPSFPVVELAKALQLWNSDADVFEYSSQESDVPPLVVFRGERGFYVASPLSGTCGGAVVDAAAVTRAFNAIVDAVRTALGKQGLDQYLL